MRNKASLILMEQLIMLLVFALAAAACLGIFAGADRISRSAEAQDAAVILARNGAETLKACSGDFAAAAKSLKGQIKGDLITVCYDRDLTPMPEGCYMLMLQGKSASTARLGAADVWVVSRDAPDVPLFSLSIAWQEG